MHAHEMFPCGYMKFDLASVMAREILNRFSYNVLYKTIVLNRMCDRYTLSYKVRGT